MAASSSFIDKGLIMDWSADENLYSRFKMWKQRCELLFTGPMAKIDEEIQCKHLFYWAGEHALELFNSWGLSAEGQKKLKNYWKKFENYVKPHSNELIAAWELHNLRQSILVKAQADHPMCSWLIIVDKVCLCYPSEHHDRFLRDFLVLGMNSDHVKKECFKEGNALTFSKAREMAKADESAEKQLQLMNPVVSEVHPVNSTMKTQFQSDQLNPVAGGSRQNPKGNKSGKTQLCRNCGWALTLVNSAQQEMRHVITAKRWDTLPSPSVRTCATADACWLLEKLNHYVFGKKVVIETDHKPHESIWKKSISSASPRLQRLLLKMAKYNVEIRYSQGKSNVIADALSRISHIEPSVEDNEVRVVELDKISRTLPASPAKLDEIRECTDQDVVLSHLKDVVHHGWPEYPNECPQDLKEFWNFREYLSVENGLILKGHKLVIPSKLRPQMLQIIHQGHMGTEKCLLRARDSLFWPGISRDIKEMTKNCPTCAQFSKQQPKETLHPHKIPSYPWPKLGCDLFDHGGAQY
ncbi:hypothetical protein ACROYT_G042698 [Oculina patagonica]